MLFHRTSTVPCQTPRHRLLLCCLLAALVGGCASTSSAPVSVPTWQESVENYVRKEGNGDPSVLRNMTWSPGQKGFSVLSAAQPAQATDVHGILLAHPAAGGRTWFVFLVGQVEKQDVKDLRLAALSSRGSELDWKLTPADPKALARYRQHRQTDPKKTVAFPRASDLFDVSATGGRVTVTDRASGAQWSVNLP